MAVFNIILNIFFIALIALGVLLLLMSKTVHTYIGPSAKLILKRPYLWLIGAFAGLAAFGGEMNFIVQKSYNVADFRDFITVVRDVVVQGQANEFVTLIKRGFTANPLLMIGYILLLILLALAIYWLILMSQGIIMRYAGRAATGNQPSILDAVSMAARKFWEIVKIAVIFLLIGWGTWLVVVGIPTIIFFLTNNGAWTYVAQVGWYISILVSFVNLILIQFAMTGVVLYEQPAMVSISKALNLFRRNVLISLELSLVLYMVNFIALWLIFALLAVYIFPTNITNLVIDLVIMFIELGLTAAFSYSSMTTLYTRLQKESPEGKLGQWTEKIVNLAATKKTA